MERFPPVDLLPGDEMVIRVPGGGGFGDPKQREPELVRRDVAVGLVSRQAAKAVYGVEV